MLLPKWLPSSSTASLKQATSKLKLNNYDILPNCRNVLVEMLTSCQLTLRYRQLFAKHQQKYQLIWRQASSIARVTSIKSTNHCWSLLIIADTARQWSDFGPKKIILIGKNWHIVKEPKKGSKDLCPVFMQGAQTQILRECF